MSDLALSARGVRKSFGPLTVLHSIDLDVAQGSITAVLGPSGCGKTTFLRLVAGFDCPDAGTVQVGGVVVADPAHGVLLPPERRRVGIVPQEGALFPHLDVAGNVGFGLPRGAASAARVAELLELVGLGGAERKRPHQLSGGQQQRVALARALAPRPSLILLDEPFSSLDAALRSQVRDEVFDVLRAEQATAVLVTHDQQEALSVADQVAVLLGGRVAQCADPNTLYNDPADLAVATFVGEAVVVRGPLEHGVVHSSLGPLQARPTVDNSRVVDAVVRPEQIRVATTLPEAGDGAVAATVIGRSFYGHDGVARLRVQGADGAVQFGARLPAGHLPDRGDEVWVRVNGAVPVFAAMNSGDVSADG